MMSKAEKVVRYYTLCNKLKDVVRTGWGHWNVRRERVESVAEHIFGVQMLAIAIQSEYKYEIDISKVIFMLAVHELEEIVIGDLTQFEISKEEKMRRGHEAVGQILGEMLDREEIMALIMEFDERKTKEARFAHRCDKLEADIQSKIYDEEGCVDLLRQEGNPAMEDVKVQELLKTGDSWSGMWLKFGRARYDYDENFVEISEYVEGNGVSRFRERDF